MLFCTFTNNLIQNSSIPHKHWQVCNIFISYSKFLVTINWCWHNHQFSSIKLRHYIHTATSMKSELCPNLFLTDITKRSQLITTKIKTKLKHKLEAFVIYRYITNLAINGWQSVIGIHCESLAEQNLNTDFTEWQIN